MRGAPTATLIVLRLAGASAVAAQVVPDSSIRRRAAVTAVTQGTVYIDAGRNDGLREGTVVRVARLGPAGRYVVAYLSSRSAACHGDSASVLPVVGDTVEFVPARVEPVVTEARAVRRAGRGLRGRAGIRYFGFFERESGTTLRQPGIELFLDGPVAPGSSVALAVDVRSRRTTTSRTGQATSSQGLMGVYQAAIRVQAPQGPVRAIIGRQYAPMLAGVGLFDGLLIDFQRPRWGAGLLAGLAPELGTLAVSSGIRQIGGYVQGKSPPGSPVRWSLSTGAMASYDRGEVNREFAFVQGTLSSRTVSVLALQELDLNRGWKADAGESRLVPTSTFLSMNLSPADGLSLHAGLDNRRSVRLYRDLTTPEELFDDRFRFGVWGGMQVALARNLRLGGDVRTSTVRGADSLRNTAVSAVASVDRLTSAGLGARVRATRYRTPGRNSGLLLAGTLRIAPGAAGSLELSGGRRGEAGTPESERAWAGVSADLTLRRSWFAVFSYSREWGRAGLTPTTDQLYTGVSYRF